MENNCVNFNFNGLFMFLIFLVMVWEVRKLGNNICFMNVLLLILGEFEIEIEIWILSISVMNYIDSEFCCVKWFIGKFVELVEIF